MTYSLSPLENCWQQLSGVIPAEQVRAEFKHAVKEVGKQLRMPGFRPGKAPESAVLARAGEEVRQHTVEHLVNDVLHNEFAVRKLVPVANPQLEKLEWDGTPDGKFEFSVKFEVPPVFEPKGIPALTVPDFKVEVTEKEVEEQIALMRRRHGKLEALENDAAAPGHVLVAELSGAGPEGEALPPKDHWVKLPDAKNPSSADNDLFGPHLIGMKTGEEKQFPINYPADADPALAGKVFTMTAKAKKLYKEELPALDDEFAKKFEFDTLAALRDKVREQTAREKAMAVEDAQRGALLAQLREANPVPLPEGLIARELQNRLQNLAREMVARGLKAEDLKDRWEEMRQREEAGVKLAVHNTLILEMVAEQDGIYATDEALQEAIEARAKFSGKPVAHIRAELEQSGEIEYLGESLRRAEVLKTLLAGAKRVPPVPSAK